MFEIDGKQYKLKYNIGRIQMIEAATGRSVMADMAKDGGMLGISQLKIYFAYGLKEDGVDTFVPVKRGMEMCEALIESEGYVKICGSVVEALEENCPFFFRGA